MSSADSEMSGEHSPSPPAAAAANGSPRPADVKAGKDTQCASVDLVVPYILRSAVLIEPT